MLLISNTIQKITGASPEKIKVEHTGSLIHGDYSSNIALILAKENNKSSKEVSEDLVKKLEREIEDGELKGIIEKVESAGPGFINFFICSSHLSQKVLSIPNSSKTLLGKKMLFEYTDPNPFKEFHVGHLMSNAIGESLSRIAEWRGAEIKRANYQGDVGPHVAKAIWGMISLDKEIPKEDDNMKEKVSFLGKAYSIGSKMYEDNKEEIDELNRKIYQKSDEKVNKLYELGRKWSLEAFEEMYKKLDTKFDYYFFESEMAENGILIVKKFLEKGVFEESEGAIIFKGERRDPSLHTRVYITSQGLPTYEAKELALNETKKKIGSWDSSVVITANEQTGVFNVGLEALKEIDSEMARKTKHIAHGMMRLKSGKMSSREGNVITGESLIDSAKEVVLEKMKEGDMNQDEKHKVAENIAVGAIKYSILKQSPGKDIIYDPAIATSFEGDSGPYLQYTYARINSLIQKAKEIGIDTSGSLNREFIEEEKDVVRLVSRFEEIVERAGDNWSPNFIATYAIELASMFNSMYAKLKIVDESDRETSLFRVLISKSVGEVIKSCLWLLGIKAPERM